MKATILDIVLLQCIFACTLGCQPQMCRKKRQVDGSQGRVKFQNVVGCSGRSPQWTRQIAYCLNLAEAIMVFRTKEWYEETYPTCGERGCSVLSNAKEIQNIDQCVRCWKEKIISHRIAANFTDAITNEKIASCVNDYIYAFLNQSQPTLDALSRHKYQIGVPESRPANYWWSVTVELPCKPKSFVFFNAYCINSFGTDLSAGQYVLVRNNLVRTKSGMTFFVEYTEDCIFEAKDIKIIWSESSPTPALPQTNTLSSSFVPTRTTTLDIYYDIEAAERLTFVDGGFVEEYDTALRKDKGKRRRRQVRNQNSQDPVNNNLSKFGLVFPCVIGSLAVSQKDQSYRIEASTGNKYLIDATGLKSKKGQTSKFEFDLNFGKSGCLFDAGDVLTLPNPPPDWPSQEKTGLACVTCDNARSDKECAELGINTICMKNEVCQTEIRHISKRQKLITKTCKRRNVCRRNSELKNNSKECNPGRPGSACICCCDSDLCNAISSDC